MAPLGEKKRLLFTDTVKRGTFFLPHKGGACVLNHTDIFLAQHEADVILNKPQK